MSMKIFDAKLIDIYWFIISHTYDCKYNQHNALSKHYAYSENKCNLKSEE